MKFSILAGLKVIERYNHSVDICYAGTRFTPLGTDATVAYSHKDLSIQNNFNFPIKFLLEINENTLNISFLSTEKINQTELNITTQNSNNQTIVIVKNKQNQHINTSTFKDLTV